MSYKKNKYLKDLLLEHVSNAHFSKGLVCPHCEYPVVWKYGKYNNIQRYRCYCCRKTFTSRTKTFIAGTHYNEKWMEYIRCFEQCLSLRMCAKTVGISLTTAFNWRHRLLEYLKSNKNGKFIGDVEINEKLISISRKGERKLYDRKPRSRGCQPVLLQNKRVLIIAMDHYGNRSLSLLRNHYIEWDEFNNELLTKIDDTNKVIFRGSYTLKKYLYLSYIHRLSGQNYQHSSIIGKCNMRCSFSYESELFGWLGNFKGIATKYLEKYLKWFEFLKTDYVDNCRIIYQLI